MRDGPGSTHTPSPGREGPVSDPLNGGPEDEDEVSMPAPLAPSAYGYGPYDNAALVAIADRLRTLGRTEGFIMRRVYAPFIIGGPA